ncbi:serine/threonine-protein kinase RUNKEL [Andrographis paniculata]|uniref:serine/threonine-protein kinase RUNKEL n=1 Tax=Andrographis paniculata TaxID=175694 RepID=UPI0021E715BC|nr:serine/threonine-protein kinase RUNKEL [Andrographis paniculata]XP_051152616.1 serine/threonine-protein kinase RUNKEL [Andrographis paniculata]
MNHYHIYEAIGRGKYSTVYKGRKKKTIEYFAIKSVDKSHKTKVLQEVRVLHTLDHHNVLRFYSWYETSAHLWLVLEYCVGGDLLTLLQQDGKLPEESIHDLAHDLVNALQYLHSKGIIYCDLKPSNILLDENGHTKLCDFGLARKLSDISAAPSSQLPQAKRGTPCYMAPELFQDGGVHSYASDFWALGCVLYECYTGKPPFVGKEFTQLAKAILLDAVPELPGTPSRPFVNLINSLLIKDPAERIQWPELCNHAFWRLKFVPLALPPQPAFADMIEMSSEPQLTERNGNRPLRNKTPPKTYGKDSRVHGKQDENFAAGVKGEETPIKSAIIGRKTQAKQSGRTPDKKNRDNTSGVHLLRLSRIAKSNLQRENEKENYRRPLPNSSKNDAEVKIENNDMELDFNESTEDEGPDETEGPDNVSSTTDDSLSTPNKTEEKLDVANNVKNQLDTSNVDGTPLLDDSKAQDHDSSSDMEVSPATPPSASLQQKTQRTKDVSGRALDFGTEKSSMDLSEVLWHQSDLSVRPVMPSRKFDKGLDAIPSLPFHVILPSDFTKTPKDKLDVLYSRIVSIMNGNVNVEKQNVIRYLEMLSTNADAANLLTNGPIMLVLVKMLRQSKALALRVQLSSLVGLLIRHSTFIGDDLAVSGILGALTDGLRDRQEKVRRFSMAALGELLFYISTLNDPAKDNYSQESPSKDNRPSSCWQVPNSLISLISSVLRKGEDDLTQLYALRTIENISSHGGYWATRFTSQDVISNLCYIYRASGKQESMRLTAGSCLARLVRFNQTCIQHVIEKLPLKEITSSLFKGNQREQQICLNLLNMALLGSNSLANVGRYIVTLIEDKNLVSNLLSLIEQGSEVLRGKALLFVALLCKNGKRCLSHFFCNARLLSAVDRLAKEKDKYVQQCLDAFVKTVVSTLPGLLETITGDIQQLMGGRRHGQSASRSTPKNSVQFFPVVLHLLGSFSFKHLVVTPQILQLVSNLLKLTESPFQGRDDFQITLLRILESISEEPTAISNNPVIFIRQVLPGLVALYKGNKDGDARCLCLKIFSDVMIHFLTQTSKDEERLEDLKAVSNIHFLPLYPSLIEDEDPIPMFAQKLLVMLIESNCIKISDILHMKAVSQCFEFLLGDFSTLNASNVMLCLALASAPELETKILSQLKVVRKIGNLLEFVCTKEMEDFIEPTLGLCKAFLLRAVPSNADVICSKQPSLINDGYTENAADPQQWIKDIVDFSGNVGVLLELTSSSEVNIADLASQCLTLLFKAAPREATMNFLMNLNKVSNILETGRRGGISYTVLDHILHALGYSCRQYMLHAMILSISTSDLAKTEALVSDLKSSSVKGVAEAAVRVASDLQRMRR